MKKQQVFEVLEPPPHGLTRLKARLREERRARWTARTVLATVVGVAVALAVVVSRPEAAPLKLVARDGVTAGLLGLAPAAGDPVTVLDASQAAAVRLPSSNPDVVLYRVAVLGDEGAPEGADDAPR